MAFQKRQSMDMASIELRNSPAPAYRPTFESQDWPLTPTKRTQSPIERTNNPYYRSSTAEDGLATSKSQALEAEAASTKPDYQDPNHPHFAGAKHTEHHAPSLPARPRRWPQKRILIPWALAIVFFLTTLWFTSMVLGVRYMSILHPSPQSPAAVQEIYVVINDELLHASASTRTVIPSITASSTLTSSPSSGPTSSPLPITTRRPNPAPIGPPLSEWIGPDLATKIEPQKRDSETKPTGFKTLARRMS